MFTVIVAVQAKNQLRKLPKAHQAPIIDSLKDVQQGPLIGKPLTRELTGLFSDRVGLYRIIYSVQKKDRKVVVLAIGHRATVYR